MKFFRHLLFLILIQLAAAGVVKAALVIDSDFGKAEHVIVNDNENQPGMSGVLPAKWEYKSTPWTNIIGQCQVQMFDSEKYLRMEISSFTAGDPTICSKKLPDPKAGDQYCLKMRVRSIDQSVIKYGLKNTKQRYTYLWEAREKLPTSWRTIIQRFRLAKAGSNVHFLIALQGKGSVEIAWIKLEKLNPQEIAQEIRNRYPGGGPANVLRNTRFPLGLQSGWMLGKDFSDDEVIITADKHLKGPSGLPSLKIKSKIPMWIKSSPFKLVAPVFKQLYALSIRGNGEWTFSIIAGQNKMIGQKTVTLSEKSRWERLKIEFEPGASRLTETMYFLKIAGKGTVYIDQLQCGSAIKAEKYATNKTYEVALACPISSASVGNIQFDDEKAEIIYCVNGGSCGGILKSKVVNLYGEEYLLSDIKVKPGKEAQYGKINYDVFVGKKYGSFRIEAWVEQNGRQISTCHEIMMHRMRRPVYWGLDAPDSPFGIHMISTKRRIVMMKAAGINWVRLHDSGTTGYTGWYHLESKKGKWTFRDKEIYRYRKYNIKIFAQLGTAPKWASYLKNNPSGHWYMDRYYQPLDMNDFVNYVRVLVKRYKGVIDCYFVWNEPWSQARWAVLNDKRKRGLGGYRTSENPAEDFATLQLVSYNAVKSIDSSIKLAGFCTARTYGGRKMDGKLWTARLLAAGGLKSCGIIGYHQYADPDKLPGFPGDEFKTSYNYALGPIIDFYKGEIKKRYG